LKMGKTAFVHLLQMRWLEGGKGLTIRFVKRIGHLVKMRFKKRAQEPKLDS